MNGLGVLFLWISVALSIALAMGWRTLVSWADVNPNMASWVQAIGSIAAILATGWGVYWAQARQESRHQSAEEARRYATLNAAYQLVQGAASTLTQISDDEMFGPPPPVDLMTLQGQFDGLSHALRSMNLSAFSEYAVIEAIVTTDAVLQKMMRLIANALAHPAALQLEWIGVKGEAVQASVIVSERAATLRSVSSKSARS